MKFPHFIVDSSVVGSWYLPDEYDTNALSIKDDFALDIVTISIPLLLFYEVNNVLRNAVVQLRIDQEEAIKAYHNLFALHFITHFSQDLLKSALERALLWGITSYDASYVILAEYLKVPLFTADKKLVEKAKSKYVKPLDSYVSYAKPD